LLEAILDYQKRDRRYGGLSEADGDAEPAATALVGAISRNHRNHSPVDHRATRSLADYSE
jgi:hypothetical protein